MTTYGTESDKKWWEQQWLDLLNSYRFKKRLERARRYAMEGNVLSIDFQEQKVIARVQGTEAEPYKISLWLDAFTDEDWQYIIETLSQRAIFSAKLLAGEMPPNIEEVFAANGLRLFPFTLQEIHSRCSCPDQANPCKHIGAVYYLLGDRFSEDPFLLFQLRGRNKQQIIAEMREQRGNETDDSTGETAPEKADDHRLHKTQFSPKIERFWQYAQQLDSGLVVIAPPPSSETILDVLGSLGSATLMQYFREVYSNVSQQAILDGLNRE
ncbi:MAG TPA: SWIM zinc finger family protein [Oscillatoriaceae cyanobacterium M33_DOE_052]|uniref:SWIM-type domain-containing protein n=1 Tax=Planktothricoides sp. SpSt-374 TaxID=2282167 RepID=A0A7C3VM38_9CYAN|nr:SWIM zinc finger family protein [Oscillatoriaceae cyanobacterium M33_DOE_052]